MTSAEGRRGATPPDPRSSPSNPVKRALLLAVVLAVTSVPAIVAFGGCSGTDCGQTSLARQHVPFCSLPEGIRTRIAAGYQDGRSPELFAVSAATPIVGSTQNLPADLLVPSISVDGAVEARVPLVFTGPGIAPARLPAGTTLDDVEPTLIRVLGMKTPNRARTGSDIPDVQFSGRPPRLVVLVAWEGAGSIDLGPNASNWPGLAQALQSGVGTLSADTGSLPVDPAAVLSTIGTGSLPSEHGITGTWLRSPYGDKVVHAGGLHGPPAALPTFAQELVHATRRHSRVALVAPTSADQGLVGTLYFISDGRPTVKLTTPEREVAASRELLRGGLGTHPTPDVLAVVLRGPVASVDRATRSVLTSAAVATGNRYVAVIAGTGSTAVQGKAIPARDAARLLTKRLPAAAEVIKAVVPGGIYLTRGAAHAGVSGRELSDALLQLRGPSTERLMADSFGAFAVSLGKYCGG